MLVSLTKNRINHVSITVRCAGSIENQDMLWNKAPYSRVQGFYLQTHQFPVDYELNIVN